MNIIFFGSPQYSCKVLNTLKSHEHKLSAVVTQNFKKSRNKKEKDTPVGQFASSNNIEVLRPVNLSEKDFLQKIKSLKADLYIIYSYGKILPKELISFPRYGVINIHCSLLPKWRGAAPIQRALMNDDKKTGITFFKIDENLDTGEILKYYDFKIYDDDDSLTLQTKLSDLASGKLIELLDNDFLNLNNMIQDSSSATYAKKIKKEEAIINWDEPSRVIFCKIRALVGWPVAETELFGKRLKLWKSNYIKKEHKFSSGSVVGFTPEALSIASIDGVVNIEKLQIPGKSIVSARDLYNSNGDLTNKIKGYFNK